MSFVVQGKTYTVVLTSDIDGGFVGRCDELHANSQGESYGKTVENMYDAVKLAAKESSKADDFNMLIVQK